MTSTLLFTAGIAIKIPFGQNSFLDKLKAGENEIYINDDGDNKSIWVIMIYEAQLCPMI